MYKIILTFAVMCNLAAFHSATHAQFLKNLKDKVNETIDNANDANDVKYERASYENFKQWKPAKNFTEAFEKYNLEVGDMDFDLSGSEERSKAMSTEYDKWSKHIYLFDAKTANVYNTHNQKGLVGAYTVTGNIVEIKNASGAVTKFEVLQKGKNYCFRVNTPSGVGYLSMIRQPKSDIEKTDAEFATFVHLTHISKLNNKPYYVLRNFKNGVGNHIIKDNKLRYTEIIDRSYSRTDITFIEFPVESIKLETMKPSRNSTNVYLEFEVDGNYEVERHLAGQDKIEISKIDKVYKTELGYGSTDNLKAFIDLIARNANAAQKAKYDGIKSKLAADIKKIDTELAAEIARIEQANQRSSEAAKEKFVTITLVNKKLSKFDVEEIPTNGECTYQSYTFRADEKQRTITFCVGSTVKIKNGKTLFVAKKADNGTQFLIWD